MFKSEIEIPLTYEKNYLPPVALHLINNYISINDSLFTCFQKVKNIHLEPFKCKLELEPISIITIPSPPISSISNIPPSTEQWNKLKTIVRKYTKLKGQEEGEEAKRNSLLPYDLFVFIARELIFSVASLHKSSMVHGSLQSSLIVLQKQNIKGTKLKLKIGGVESCLLMNSKNTKWIRSLSSCLSTYLKYPSSYYFNKFTAPEILKQVQDTTSTITKIEYTPAADTWSLGILLFYCLTNSCIFETICKKSNPLISTAITFPIPKKCSPKSLSNLIEEIWKIKEYSVDFNFIHLIEQNLIENNKKMEERQRWTSESLSDVIDLLSRLLQWDSKERSKINLHNLLLNHHLFTSFEEETDISISSSSSSSPRPFLDFLNPEEQKERNLLLPSSPNSKYFGTESPLILLKEYSLATLLWRRNLLYREIHKIIYRYPFLCTVPLWVQVSYNVINKAIILWTTTQLKKRILQFQNNNKIVYYRIIMVCIWIIQNIQLAQQETNNNNNTISFWDVSDCHLQFELQWPTLKNLSLAEWKELQKEILQLLHFNICSHSFF